MTDSPQRPPLLSATAWSFLSGLVTTLFGLCISILMARALGPTALGHYSYWFWVVGILPGLFGFGLWPAALKFSAELLGRDQPGLARAVVLALARVQGAVSVTLAGILLLIGAVGAPGAGLTLHALVAALLILGGQAASLGSAIKGAMDYKFAAALTARGKSR